MAWVIAAGLAVDGWVTNDIVAPALLGGLVLIVVLIGCTVMQHAFAGGITPGPAPENPTVETDSVADDTVLIEPVSVSRLQRQKAGLSSFWSRFLLLCTVN